MIPKIKIILGLKDNEPIYDTLDLKPDRQTIDQLQEKLDQMSYDHAIELNFLRIKARQNKNTYDHLWKNIYEEALKNPIENSLEYHRIKRSITFMKQKLGLINKQNFDNLINVDAARKYSIVDLCKSYGIILNRDMALCPFNSVYPFHSERTPSFKIYKDNNRFCCFGCGTKGTNIDLVMKLEDVGFIDAVKILNKK